MIFWPSSLLPILVPEYSQDYNKWYQNWGWLNKIWQLRNSPSFPKKAITISVIFESWIVLSHILKWNNILCNSYLPILQVLLYYQTCSEYDLCFLFFSLKRYNIIYSSSSSSCNKIFSHSFNVRMKYFHRMTPILMRLSNFIYQISSTLLSFPAFLAWIGYLHSITYGWLCKDSKWSDAYILFAPSYHVINSFTELS